MVYYNKDLFAKYGIAGADHVRRVHRGDGHVRQARASPRSPNAGAEYPAQQNLYELALSQGRPRRGCSDYELYKGKVDFHDAAWTYAASTFADWVKKGYIAKNSVSLKAEDMGNAFETGQEPDPDLRQLVVRPLRERDQELRVGHVPVSRATR